MTVSEKTLDGSDRYAPGWRQASPGAVAFGVAQVVLCVAQLVAAVVAFRTPEIPAVFAVLPLVALAVGWLRFGDAPLGPQIHDRQLDRIVGLGAALGAATLLAAAATGAGRHLELLAVPATVTAVLASRFGVRMLWQLRAAPLALLLTWPTPWLHVDSAAAALPAGLADGAVAAAVVAVPLALAARVAWPRRIAAVPLAAVAGAGIARLVVLADPSAPAALIGGVAASVGAALLLLTVLPARSLGSTGTPSGGHPMGRTIPGPGRRGADLEAATAA